MNKGFTKLLNNYILPAGVLTVVVIISLIAIGHMDTPEYKALEMSLLEFSIVWYLTMVFTLYLGTVVINATHVVLLLLASLVIKATRGITNTWSVLYLLSSIFNGGLFTGGLRWRKETLEERISTLDTTLTFWKIISHLGVPTKEALPNEVYLLLANYKNLCPLCSSYYQEHSKVCRDCPLGSCVKGSLYHTWETGGPEEKELAAKKIIHILEKELKELENDRG